MKFTITLLLALFLCSFSSFSQSMYGVKGAVSDSASASKLANTTICVLNAKDSTLVKFTRAEANGHFAINNLSKGKFLLMVTYPDYADYVEFFTLDSVKREKDFGKLNMQLKSRLLHEIMVKGTKAAIKIKGDTTEFNASSFVVQPNAKVEDLLKQLPGIQVDKDGKITAQGQTVNKVLVDGEEFFGDDPTLVTKNIRADMVDKVQLYDKKSDQASFTGIDDGVKNKTINIKLKEDKKNGYFGKVDVGAGTDKFYQGQGAFNIFKAKQKLSVYGTIANTGKTGLGWDDAAKYGGGNDMQMTDDGGIYFQSSRDDLESYDGNYDGKGIPVARTGGAHYDTKFGGGDKESINANYKIGYLSVNGINNSIIQNNIPFTPATSTTAAIPASILNNTSDQTYNNSIFRQKFNTTYQWKIDSLSNLKVSADGTLKHSEAHSNYLSAGYRNFDTLLNKSNRTINNNLDGRVLNASVFYNKKFMKKGRSFSWNVAEAYNDNTTAGYLNQSTEFHNYKTGALDSTQVTDQYKTGKTIGSNLTSNITYSEPFSKTLSLIMNYGTGYNRSTSDRKSFNKGVTGVYNKIVDSLSNDYEFNQFSNQVGAVFNYRTNKTVLNFGSKATNVQFDQINQLTNTNFKRTFLNWNPQANYQYKFSQYRSFYAGYTGSTTQPTIDQIQPVANNNVLGNPDLKPSFRNNFELRYNSYKVLSGQSVYFNASYSVTNNPIVNNSFIDTKTGRTVSEASNLTTKSPFSFYFYSGYNQKIKNINYSVGLNGDANQTYNYSNGFLNTTKSYNYASRFGVSRYIEKKFDVYFSVNPGYSISQTTSENSTINNNGFKMTGYSYVNVYLPGKFQISYDADYEYRAKTASFDDDFSKLIFNSTLSKKFLKDEGLKLSLTVNDLFNQNVGFSRTANGGYISQNTYTSIKRYFMFSISYDFSHMGGGAPAAK
ncbi:outer membrane receptor protein involved in Fe transport [Mucilaginibacter gracilis]|uniref:Outer membrane receptor protein involved in Fe transport n=1 Tax=Mucilaginibacter gracilis TaxID=423350 RepID=A0A495J1A5_9SPHI|nr:TonB-dependent receptor [Mucilaginibacter gracilis]RKR82533.1 outer membrane receptor protein involved in Fe transport [Mucilaginibacter gracilis]